MTEQPQHDPREQQDQTSEVDDPDAGPASVPSGAATEPLPTGTDDQDAGAASEPPD